MESWSSDLKVSLVQLMVDLFLFHPMQTSMYTLENNYKKHFNHVLPMFVLNGILEFRSKGLARATNGRFVFIPPDANVDVYVGEQLQKALQPCITNVRVKWNLGVPI